MKTFRLLSILLFTFFIKASYAGSVHQVQVFSPSMQKHVAVSVVLPDGIKEGKEYPVIYLLHGYSGSEADWIKIKPNLDELADRYGVILVSPDAKNSWYMDSPVKTASKYETFVASELVEYIDRNYKTKANREGRAITGLSMGGHGALWLAIRHKDKFGAAGSTSGGVDFRPFPNNWELKELLGEQRENIELWNSHTVINLIDSLQNKEIELIVDCGYDDFFFPVNNKFHLRLLEKGIEHDYIVRPGAHNHAYWRNSIDYQLLFFSNYFNQ